MSGNSAGASLTYNAKNQTTAMTYGGQTLSPLSYADVDQTERTQAGSTTFASSPLGVQIAKNGTNSTFYTRDNKGNLIGERTPDGNRWYYLEDGLGSVVAVITDAGSVRPSNFPDPSGYFWSWGQIGKFAGLTLGGCVFTVAALFKFVGGPGAIVYVAIAQAIPGVDVSADVVFAVVAVTACISGAIFANVLGRAYRSP